MNNPASNFGATPAGGVYGGKPHGSVDDPYALIAELSKALKGVLAIAEGKTGVRLYPKDARLIAAHSALKKAKAIRDHV